jgi:DNA anti-recombination protein RmuC
MTENAVPPLALTLAAAASSRLHLEEREAELRQAFTESVARMDEADDRYRRAIERSLTKDAASVLFTSMTSFRDQVRDIRERARREIGDIYRRYGMTYGAFDPLDPYVPPTSGFSHADSTRVATIADRARGTVEEYRAQINDAALRQLSQNQIEQLISAKRARIASFEAAVQPVLQKIADDRSGVTTLERDKALYALAQLADGWY